MAARVARREGSHLKRGIPDRGDILLADLDSTRGHEQQGKRPVLVLSVAEFNRFGLVLACPITRGGELAREHGFAVPLGGGARTMGIVLCHQVRTLDYKDRQARFSESLAETIVEEVLARVRALLD